MGKAHCIKVRSSDSKNKKFLSTSPKSLTILKKKNEEAAISNLLKELKSTVPALHSTPESDVTSLDIIQQAIFYIHDLWTALEDDEDAAMSGFDLKKHIKNLKSPKAVC
ncbi:uncharacterized protein LOC143449675 [Clavelina lepadiformis]|uniref:BHLH domain-containing protein n=1 Tax=Clavelina lepadiformis TaxID=159417 RepID=A0ABP0H1J3_CLALP